MPISITISPAGATPLAGVSVQFTPTVTGDASNSGVTWRLQSEAVPDLPLGNGLAARFTPIAALGEAVGSIDANGLYTAPQFTRSTPPRVRVIAQSVADPRVTAEALVLLFNETYTAYTASATGGNDQWDVCVLCGKPYAMPDLIKQKGRMVCRQTCMDDLLIERRNLMLTRLFQAVSSVEPEGSDRRQLDRGFFVVDVNSG